MRATAPVLALFTAILAFATPANAAADSTATANTTVQADLNGDGRLDLVAVSPVPDNPNEQYLGVNLGQVGLRTRVPLSSEEGVQPLRVVDVNNDGRDEVLVTETVGANTNWFSVWGLFDGLRPVVRDDQTRLMLWEGGGATSFSRYGCEVAGGGNRQLVTTRAALVDGEMDYYEGERLTYTVHINGMATVRSRAAMEGFRDSAIFLTNPQACA